MKKYFFLGLLMSLLTTTVTAQSVPDRIRHHRLRQRFIDQELTRPELLDLSRNQLRYRMADRRVHRDGVVTPFERRKLQKMKRQNRVQLWRYRHNPHRRVI